MNVLKIGGLAVIVLIAGCAGWGFIVFKSRSAETDMGKPWHSHVIPSPTKAPSIIPTPVIPIVVPASSPSIRHERIKPMVTSSSDYANVWVPPYTDVDGHAVAGRWSQEKVSDLNSDQQRHIVTLQQINLPPPQDSQMKQGMQEDVNDIANEIRNATTVSQLYRISSELQDVSNAYSESLVSSRIPGAPRSAVSGIDYMRVSQLKIAADKKIEYLQVGGERSYLASGYRAAWMLPLHEATLSDYQREVEGRQFMQTQVNNLARDTGFIGGSHGRSRTPQIDNNPIVAGPPPNAPQVNTR